jgi:cytochrome c biogenesis protein ResB
MKNTEFVDFQVSKPVSLAGVRLYGNQLCDYKIKLKIQETNVNSNEQNYSPLFETDGYVTYSTESEMIDDSYYGFTVLVDNPVRLEAGKTYTIEANYDSNCSSYNYGYEGIKEIQVDDVMITFMDNKDPNASSPSSLSGQFPSLLLNFNHDKKHPSY